MLRHLLTLALLLVVMLTKAFACPHQYHPHKDQTFEPKAIHRKLYWMT